MFNALLLGTVLKITALTSPSAAGVPAIEGEALPHAAWHHMVMPGETVTYTVPVGSRAFLNGEPLAGKSELTAPEEPGVYKLEFRKLNGDSHHQLALFVLEPADEVKSDGRLNGFRMGVYPQDTPRGYIRLDEGHGDIKVSPSFRIGQFLCHQQPDHWPKYLLISSSNLERLELLLASLNEDGITDAETFFVMSGYRSPFYNTAIGSAKLSRHMYGDATDIYVDVAPRDGVMDDLNADGAINKADADFLYDYAQDLFASTSGVSKGGLGSYKANAVHGPFVHVDGRGRAARWGR
jgi:hypothetical protein